MKITRELILTCLNELGVVRAAARDDPLRWSASDLATDLASLMEGCKFDNWQLQNIDRLLEAIDYAERIWRADDVSAEDKYAIIFNWHSNTIEKIIDVLGVKFEWCDPDTTYEEDVAAFMNALLGLKERMTKIKEAACTTK